MCGCRLLVFVIVLVIFLIGLAVVAALYFFIFAQPALPVLSFGAYPGCLIGDGLQRVVLP